MVGPAAVGVIPVEVAPGVVGGFRVIEIASTGGKTVLGAVAVTRTPLTDRVTEAVSVVGVVGTGPLKLQVADWPGVRTVPIRLGQMSRVVPSTVSVRAVMVPSEALVLVTTTR
ncbi:MAG: hypothetical protein ACYCTI_01470 [Acidimicrobiales bacterium]